jgi:uncharacterized protein (DUF1800 family)
LSLEEMSPDALFSANLLNRIAYGPTPDELTRVLGMGPTAYIEEQLAPETVSTPPPDTYISVKTNAISQPSPMWTSITVTGLVSTPRLYMYLTQIGQVSVDNVQIRYRHVLTAITNNGGVSTTNVSTITGTNIMTNGDFEQPLANGWNVTASHAGSYIDSTTASSGAASLRLVASAPGQTQTNSIWQNLPPAPVAGTTTGNTPTGGRYTNTISTVRLVLSFDYVPSSDSDLLTLRLSGSGTIISAAEPPDTPEWVYATATGNADATPRLYVYLSAPGETHIDDLKLVAGTVPEAGPNLLTNGDFEQPLTNAWQLTSGFTNSVIDNTIAYSGSGSLHIISTTNGSGSGNAIFQAVPTTSGRTYTVSYWYRPAARGRASLTVRLSGNQLVSTPDSSTANPSRIKRMLDDANWSVTLDELRRWHCRNGVLSQRQLLEVLTQFFENHFVTYHAKTADYFDRYYDGGILDRIATDLEYREVSRWRQTLMNPNCNFYDLLKIHVESPAQIIYLDTVGSRGDGDRIANENYARELFELFAMGVDNGYDQNDIVAMSRAWTGWTVDIVPRNQMDNPFAIGAVRSPETAQYGYFPGAGYNAISNVIGVWTFVFNPAMHGTNRAPILSVWDPNGSATNPRAIGPKIIPPRFGPPWAGQSYQLVIPRRTGNSAIQDGYDVIRHLSELPFTAEYLSIKLCRLFVHDQFPNPTTRPDLPEYSFYDYTNPNRTPEAELVRQCIVAWMNPGPDGRKGNIRSVLRTIFNSELFRSHAGSRQKIKTPLEFVVSSVRSMYSASPTPTASTDGNFATSLSRMGQMSLFNRADPDGYPEDGSPWISAGTLTERLRFVQVLCMDGGRPSGEPTGHNVDPVVLLQRKLTAAQQRDPAAVADLFLSYLFLGEGRANLDQYRTAAINFLNDGSADPTPSTTPFSQLAVSTSASSQYDIRVRGMVAMLMTLQRFQEQ